MLQLSDLDSDKASLYEYYEKFTKIANQEGFEFNEEPNALITINKQAIADGYCENFDLFFQNTKDKYYVFFILDKYKEMYDLSFLNYKNVHTEVVSLSGDNKADAANNLLNKIKLVA